MMGATKGLQEVEAMATVGKPQAGVRSRRWSKGEYYRLAEAGLFHGQRVELLEGQIMVLSPQKAPHFSTVDRVTEALRRHFGSGYQVRMQGPIDFGQTSEPEPDVAVVVGERADFAQAHPTSAVLIVEVSDTTVSYDRRRKGSLYARAGVADYWIVNLRRGWLEVHRAPIADATWHYGHRYSSRTDLLPGAVVAPLALPAVSIAIADLLG
jgi:Uma2 family endonuclease